MRIHVCVQGNGDLLRISKFLKALVWVCGYVMGDCVVAMSSQVKFVWDQRWCTLGAVDEHLHKDLKQFQWTAWNSNSCFVFVRKCLQSEASA